MGIKTLIMILASLSFSVSALAEHHEGGEKKPFAIYGDFASSLNFYSNETSGNTNHDDFSVDLIELNLEKNWSKSSLLLSIGYGSIANAVNFGATNNGAAGANLSQNTLNVMNAVYKMHTDYGLGFMFGKFESPVGHETYNYMDNVNYSRSYGFTMAPYFSTGAGVDYGADMWRVGFIVSNGSGKDTDTRDKNKTMALVVDVDPMENLHIDLNYVTGSEGDATATTATPPGPIVKQISIMDLSISYMINEMFDVAVNYIDAGQKATTAGSTDEKGTSIALYGNANLGMFGLGLRYEMFSYDDGFVMYNGLTTGGFGVVGADNEISSITLTAKAEIDQNAVVLLEYRTDSSDDKIWTNKDGATPATEDTMDTITAALMYRF